jgi:lipopolysaccharide transport system ATP-binding protein
MKKKSLIKQQPAIRLINISKKYILHHQKPTLMENIFKFGQKEEFWALKNINLEIEKGKSFGIIGNNGSGKTTLLKVISAVTTATSGNLLIKGKIVSLIDVNSGFNPELTGEENIYLNGLLLGMKKKEIEKKFEQIISFSGLRKFIDAPFYTYSFGMKLRLGFSIAIHSEPDILLIDEVLGGGDKNFLNKTYRVIQRFSEEGKTLIFVSHFLHLIRKFCQEAVILEKGEIKTIGNTKEIIKNYSLSSNKSIY